MKNKALMVLGSLVLLPGAALAETATTLPTVHVQADTVVVNPQSISEQDRATTARVAAALQASERLRGQTIEVSTINGVVRLSGQVDLVPQIYEAVVIARRTEGVRAVNDDALL